MGLFGKKQPNDVIFLQPVRYRGEKMPRDQVRMLYCDADGRIHASIMSRSVYRLARQNAAKMAERRKPFATIGLETGPGRYVPVSVEVSPEEAWALEHILEHALRGGDMPDILKQHVRPIIRLGAITRRAAVATKEPRHRSARTPVTPQVLERLPYYPEHDIEISMPIYKAAYRYPLILLKRLPPDEQTPPGTQRLLILDSEGDIAVIGVPTRLVRQMELELNEQSRKILQPVCALISQQAEGFSADYMPISHKQKQALATLTRHFEETGTSKQPISLMAQAVISRAREKTGP